MYDSIAEEAATATPDILVDESRDGPLHLILILHPGETLLLSLKYNSAFCHSAS